MPINPKDDPWGTGEREAYRPPQVKRAVKKEGFNFVRLLKTLLTIAVLLLAANYIWKNYLNSGQ